MSTPNKITFGNTTGATHSINNNASFGYATGDYIQPGTTNYQSQSTNLYGGASSNYQPVTEKREAIYSRPPINEGYNAPINYSTVQPGNPTHATYTAVQDISRPAPVTKITFGGKQFTQTFTTKPHYTTTQNYAPPVTNTYQTYAQPTEIPIITSQPIRQQVRYEQTVQPKQVEREQVVSTPISEPVNVDAKRKSKKTKCPSWIWYLLGALLLLALIVGLVFLFINLNAKKSSTPLIQTDGTSATATADISTDTTGTIGATTVDTTTPIVTTDATYGTTGATTVDTTTPIVTTDTTYGTTGATTADTTTPIVTTDTISGMTYVTPTQNTFPTEVTTGTTSATPVDDTAFVPVFDSGFSVDPTASTVDAYGASTPTNTNTFTTGTTGSTYSYPTSTSADYTGSGYTYPTTSYDASAPTSYPVPASADYSSPIFDVQPTSVY